MSLSIPIAQNFKCILRLTIKSSSRSCTRNSSPPYRDRDRSAGCGVGVLARTSDCNFYYPSKPSGISLRPLRFLRDLCGQDLSPWIDDFRSPSLRFFAQPSLLICRARPRASDSSGTSSVTHDAAATDAPLRPLTGSTTGGGATTETRCPITAVCLPTPS